MAGKLIPLDASTLRWQHSPMSTFDTFLNHPIETLEKALHIRKQIAGLEKVLKGLFGPTPISLAGVQTIVAKPKTRRTLSPAARAKIAAAQKRRWAKSKDPQPTATAKAAAPVAKARKGGMSAEGRARIVAAQKARWAKVKAQKAAPSPVKAAPKKKRQLSPEARARIVAAVKARWARAKKAK